MNPEIETALVSLQEWANAHPDHLAALVGDRHAITTSGQNAFDCGLNYFGAQLVAESFWEVQKRGQELDTVTMQVSPTRTGMPSFWVVVSSRPLLFTELCAALSERNLEGE